jgi:TM2 domain-containing membrane protein YozV
VQSSQRSPTCSTGNTPALTFISGINPLEIYLAYQYQYTFNRQAYVAMAAWGRVSSFRIRSQACDIYEMVILMVDGTTTPPPGAPTTPPVAPVYASASAAPKNPLVSAIVSFLIPGVGQIINGQTKKGVILLVVYLVLWAVIVVVYLLGSIVTLGYGICCCLPVFFVPLLMNLYAAYDAYKTAGDINSGVFVKDWMS